MADHDDDDYDERDDEPDDDDGEGSDPDNMETSWDGLDEEQLDAPPPPPGIPDLDTHPVLDSRLLASEPEQWHAMKAMQLLDKVVLRMIEARVPLLALSMAAGDALAVTFDHLLMEAKAQQGEEGERLARAAISDILRIIKEHTETTQRTVTPHVARVQ